MPSMWLLAHIKEVEKTPLKMGATASQEKKTDESEFYRIM